MLVADTGAIIIVALVDIDHNNKVTWPSRCWVIAHCDHCCHCCSHHWVLGNVKNYCCTSILYLGMQIPSLLAPLVVTISMGYWAHGSTVCMGFQVATFLCNVLIPRSGMTSYYFFARTWRGRKRGKKRDGFLMASQLHFFNSLGC
jgi:hypothetical protein